ncbi:unnamed protein product, partial [Mesorhabditis spiculigera]
MDLDVHFDNTVEIEEDGRISVALPVQEERIDELGQNYALAARRLSSLFVKGQRDPALWAAVVENFHEQEMRGFIEDAPKQPKAEDRQTTAYPQVPARSHPSLA